MRHRQIETIGHMTIALAFNGKLYLQNGMTKFFKPLATPPSKLIKFAIAPAGIVGTGKSSASQATWILPISPQTHQPTQAWLPLPFPRMRDMASNAYAWAGIAANGAIYTGCHNRHNPTDYKTLSPLPKASKLKLNQFGIFVASAGITHFAPSLGGQGHYGPWQRCKP